MALRKNWLTCTILGLSLIISGCGGDEKTGDEKTSEKTSEKTGTTQVDEKGGNGGSGDTNIDTSTPDGAIQAVVTGIKNDQPGAVWDFLPASYQKDVNDVIHSYANAMDAELYNKGFAVAQKLVQVLKDKKQFILNSQMVSQGLAGAPVDPAELSKNWDVLVGLLETLVKSDISDVEKLKTIDGGEYLSQTGGQVMTQLSTASKLFPGDPFNTQLKSKLDQISAKVISVDGDTATIEYNEPELGARERQMTRVEGKWVPADMAADWAEGIAEMKSDLANMPEEIAANKEQVLGVLTMLDGVLTQLNGAESQEQFDQTVQQAMLPVMMMAGGLMGGGGPPEDPVVLEPVAEGAARVIVVGSDDDDQLEKVFDTLLEISGAEEGDYSVEGGQAVMNVQPVSSVKDLAAKIKFGEVVIVDEEGRTLTVVVEETLEAEPEKN